MPQGPLRQILMPPPVQSGPPVQLDPTPLAQTNPGLARLVDFFGGLTGLKDALVPESSNATVAGAGLGAALPLMGVLGSLKRVGQPITAYHGSPHDFDKFSLSKIGTGEGAQAYGPGLYMAEERAVAEGYAPRDPDFEDKLQALYKMFERRNDYDSMEVVEAAMLHQRPDQLREQYPKAGKVIDQIEKLPRKDKLYQVAIHATPDEFLDWDKPLSQQSEKVRKALAGIDADMYGVKGGDYDPNELGQQTYHRLKGMFGDTKATAVLNGKGVKGIRYLDEGSRDKGAGTSNYVVLDDQIIDIMKKYGVGLAAAATMQQQMRKDKTNGGR